MSGDPLTPAEVASMKPYERQQGGWWEYGHDESATNQVWRPAPDNKETP